MNNYGIINQDGYLCVFDRQRHKQVLRVSTFVSLAKWIMHHPGNYKFIDFDVTVFTDDITDIYSE